MTSPQNYGNPQASQDQAAAKSAAEKKTDKSAASRAIDFSYMLYMAGHVMALLTFAFILNSFIASSSSYFAVQRGEGLLSRYSVDIPSAQIAFLVIITLLILPAGLVATHLLKRGNKMDRIVSTAFLAFTVFSSIAAAVKLEPLYFSFVAIILTAVIVLEWISPFAVYFEGKKADFTRKPRPNYGPGYPYPNVPGYGQQQGYQPYQPQGYGQQQGYQPYQQQGFPQQGYQGQNPYQPGLQNPYAAPTQQEANSWRSEAQPSAHIPEESEKPENPTTQFPAEGNFDQ